MGFLTAQDIEGRTPNVRARGRVRVIPPEVEDVTENIIVGATERGPAFVPVTVNTANELERIFGSGRTYATVSARRVLEQTDQVTVVRVMNSKGWNPIPISIVADSNEGFTLWPLYDISGDVVLLAQLILDPDFEEQVDFEKIGLSGTVRQFTITFRNLDDDIIKQVTASLNPNSNKYVQKVIDQDNDVFLYVNFKETHAELFANRPDTFLGIRYRYDDLPLDFAGVRWQFARTPWILSERLADMLPQRLFRFVARGAGSRENRRVKVSIRNIDVPILDSDFTSFDVVVRAFGDTDQNEQVLERYPRVNLDATSDRFIARVIGDRVTEFDGEKIVSQGSFENQSDYIRVEMYPDFERAPDSAVPYGFEEYLPTITGDMESVASVPTKRTDQRIGKISDYIEFVNPVVGERFNDSIHFGFDFRVNQNMTWLNPVPKPNMYTIMDYEEYLDDGSGEEGFMLEDFVDRRNSTLEQRKFSVGFQGGFDGRNPTLPYGQEGVRFGFEDFDFVGSASSGAIAYQNAINLISDPDEFFYNVLSTPDLNFTDHPTLTRQFETMIRQRGDAIYLVESTPLFSEAQQAIDVSRTYESTFMAAYFGTVDVSNTDEVFDFVPACAVVPSIYTQNDNIGQPYYAPSGLNRAFISDANDVFQRFDDDEVDIFHQNSINLVRYLGNTGLYLWGQYTLTDENTLLNRVNVRRLVSTVITFARQLSLELLFEPNDVLSRQVFTAEMRAFLSDIQNNGGLEGFNIDLETVEETAQRNENKIRGVISLIPIPALENIIVNFEVQNTRVTFSEIAE